MCVVVIHAPGNPHSMASTARNACLWSDACTWCACVDVRLNHPMYCCDGGVTCGDGVSGIASVMHTRAMVTRKHPAALQGSCICMSPTDAVRLWRMLLPSAVALCVHHHTHHRAHEMPILGIVDAVRRVSTPCVASSRCLCDCCAWLLHISSCNPSQPIATPCHGFQVVVHCATQRGHDGPTTVFASLC